MDCLEANLALQQATPTRLTLYDFLLNPMKVIDQLSVGPRRHVADDGTNGVVVGVEEMGLVREVPDLEDLCGY
ncbi:hypothetical protein QYF36_017590 [Acer negundo]|nr:hypothetical protein QYF36_017590 [Acer negundo]